MLQGLRSPRRRATPKIRTRRHSQSRSLCDQSQDRPKRQYLRVVGLDTFFTPSVMSGEKDLPGVTDTERPRLRGPKRATKIRKLFNLTKEDNLKRYVKAYSRKIEKNGKVYYKTPKIQRLITPRVTRRRKDKLKTIRKHREKVRNRRRYSPSLSHKRASVMMLYDMI